MADEELLQDQDVPVDPAMEQFIKDRIQLTPELRAKQKVQDYFRNTYGIKPTSGKGRRVLASVGEALRAIGAGSKYVNPEDKAQAEALKEYQIETPVLQRESAVIAANKRASQANEAKKQIAAELNRTKLIMQMNSLDDKELEREAKSDNLTRSLAAKEIQDKRKDEREQEKNRINAMKAYSQADLYDSQTQKNLFGLGQLDPEKMNKGNEQDLTRNMIKNMFGGGIGGRGGMGTTRTTTNTRDTLQPIFDAAGNKILKSVPMSSTSTSTSIPGGGVGLSLNTPDFYQRLKMLQQRGIGGNITPPPPGAGQPGAAQGGLPAAPGQGGGPLPQGPGGPPTGAPMNQGPVRPPMGPATPSFIPKGPQAGLIDNNPQLGPKDIFAGPRSDNARNEQNADASFANSLKDVAYSFADAYRRGETANWTGVKSYFGGLRKIHRGSYSAAEMMFDKVNKNQLADYIRSKSGLQTSDNERRFLAQVLPEKSSEEQTVLRNALMSNFIFQIGMYRKRMGIDPSKTELYRGDNTYSRDISGSVTKELLDHINNLVSRINLAREGRAKMPSDTEMNPITWFESWMKDQGISGKGPKILWDKMQGMK